MEKLLKVEQVADLLQVSKSTIYDWTHTDYIPYYKLSSGVRFKESEIDKWLSKKRIKGRERYKISIIE